MKLVKELKYYEKLTLEDQIKAVIGNAVEQDKVDYLDCLSKKDIKKVNLPCFIKICNNFLSSVEKYFTDMTLTQKVIYESIKGGDKKFELDKKTIIEIHTNCNESLRREIFLHNTILGEKLYDKMKQLEFHSELYELADGWKMSDEELMKYIYPTYKEKAIRNKKNPTEKEWIDCCSEQGETSQDNKYWFWANAKHIRANAPEKVLIKEAVGKPSRYFTEYFKKRKWGKSPLIDFLRVNLLEGEIKDKEFKTFCTLCNYDEDMMKQWIEKKYNLSGN